MRQQRYITAKTRKDFVTRVDKALENGGKIVPGTQFISCSKFVHFYSVAVILPPPSMQDIIDKRVKEQVQKALRELGVEHAKSFDLGVRHAKCEMTKKES